MVERVATWARGASLPLGALDASRGLTVVGRGTGTAVTSEVALKIREVTGIRSESYAASDFAHGPIGADGADATLLLIVIEEMTDKLCELTLSGCRRAGMTTGVLAPRTRRSFEFDHEIIVARTSPTGRSVSPTSSSVRSSPFDSATSGIG